MQLGVGIFVLLINERSVLYPTLSILTNPFFLPIENAFLYSFALMNHILQIVLELILVVFQADKSLFVVDFVLSVNSSHKCFTVIIVLIWSWRWISCTY